MIYLREAEDRVRRDAGAVAAGAGAVPQVAEIDRALDAMSLVTVILETRVTSAARDESWRGDVDARVIVPVRLFFGTDLASARVTVADLGPVSRVYTIHAPPPQRLATELITGGEQTSVSLGWLRYRTRAGEYYLGQARKALSEQAAALVLDEDQSAQVRTSTRQRVESLVRLVLGPADADCARVNVVFDDETTGGTGVTPVSSLGDPDAPSAPGPSTPSRSPLARQTSADGGR